MATPGANLSYKGGSHAWAKVFRYLGIPHMGVKVHRHAVRRNAVADDGTAAVRSVNVCEKISNTAPSTNTAGDGPTGFGDFCLHYNAAGVYQAVYLCTSFTTADTTFTWTKITA